MNALIYWLTVGVIVHALAVLLAIDVYLWRAGISTISAYLRLHPWAWWVPFGLVLIAGLGMSYHLFAAN